MGSNWLQALVGGLAGGAQAGVNYVGAKREREDALAKQQQEQQFRQFQMAMQQAQQDALAEERDYDRTRTNYADLNPDTDLTTNPNLAKFEKYGMALNRTPAVSAPKLSDSMTLPSMPSSTPPTGIGGAPSTPMTGGKYDPNAPEDEAAPAAPGGIPAPLPMGGPMTVNTPTYGLGSPEKVTRAETRQESQQRVGFETRAKAMRELLPQVAPQYQSLLQNSIEALERGVEPEITSAQVMQVIQGSQPKPPSASAAPNFEYTDAFEIANGVPYDPATATPEQRKAANAEMARQKIAGTRAPSGGGGGSNGFTELQVYDRTVRAGNDFERIAGSSRRAMTQARVAQTAYGRLKELEKSGSTAIGPDTQALIMSFGKVLDETSVVRESEYDRSTEMQSMFDRFTALKEGLLRGGVLAPGVIDEMKNTIDAIYGQYEENVRDQALLAAQKIRSLGGNVENALSPSTVAMLKQWEDEQAGGTTAATAADAPPPAMLAANPGKLVTLKDGRKFKVSADGKSFEWVK